MASATALATAGAAGVSEGSPMPLAPNGPTPVPDSRMMTCVVGKSRHVGMRYSASDGVLMTPSLDDQVFHQRIAQALHAAARRSGLRPPPRLMARPMSWQAAAFSTVISPVSVSTATSTA